MKRSKVNVLFSRPKEMLNDVFNVLPSNRFNLIACPAITIERIDTSDYLSEILSDIDQFDYLVFTSQYAVMHTLAHLKLAGISPDRLTSLTLCAVGPMVSHQLSKYKLRAKMIPQTYTAKSLCEIFPSVRSGSKKVLFPRGNKALGIVEDLLTRKGYTVVDPVVYQTKETPNLGSMLEHSLASGPVDCIALTSPSSVYSFASALTDTSSIIISGKIVLAAIGPTTEKACHELGWTVDLVPSEFTAQSMARCILKYYS